MGGKCIENRCLNYMLYGFLNLEWEGYISIIGFFFKKYKGGVII